MEDDESKERLSQIERHSTTTDDVDSRRSHRSNIYPARVRNRWRVPFQPFFFWRQSHLHFMDVLFTRLYIVYFFISFDTTESVLEFGNETWRFCWLVHSTENRSYSPTLNISHCMWSHFSKRVFLLSFHYIEWKSSWVDGVELAGRFIRIFESQL